MQVWDLRQNKLIYNMHGHGDSVTGLSLSSEGSYLLSNSMDNTGRMFVFMFTAKKYFLLGHNLEFSMYYICAFLVRIWDVRPFAPKERCVKIFQGNVHNFEKVTKIFLWPSLIVEDRCNLITLTEPMLLLLFLCVRCNEKLLL